LSIVFIFFLSLGLKSCDFLKTLIKRSQNSSLHHHQPKHLDPSVGVILPLTGQYASFGISCQKAFRLAEKKENRNHTSVLIEDSNSTPQGAVQAANKLIFHHHTRVILGEIFSQATLAVAPLTTRESIPLIVPGATHPNILEHPYTIRLCFDDDHQAEALTTFLWQEKKMKQIALMINSDSDYSRNLSSKIKESFLKKGGNVLIEVFYQEQDQQHLVPLRKLFRLKNSLDVIVAPGTYQQIGPILRQAKELGLTTHFQGTDSWHEESLSELSLGATEAGFFLTTHFAPDDPQEETQNFVKRFQEQEKYIPGQMEALCYDAASFLFRRLNSYKGSVSDSKAFLKHMLKDEKFCGVSECYAFQDRRAIKPVYIVQTKKTGFTFFDKVSPKSFLN
jgi:branched-chain amino acid transport system substrate-binding protein